VLLPLPSLDEAKWRQIMSQTGIPRQV